MKAVLMWQIEDRGQQTGYRAGRLSRKVILTGPDWRPGGRSLLARHVQARA